MLERLRDESVVRGFLNKQEESVVWREFWSLVLTSTALWWRRWDPWGKLARLTEGASSEFKWEIVSIYNTDKFKSTRCQLLACRCTYILPHPHSTNMNTHTILKEYLLLWLKKTHFSQYWKKLSEKQKKDLYEALKEMEKIWRKDYLSRAEKM